MTSNDTAAEDDRITSRMWVADYKKENGEAAPAVASANMFQEGGAPEDGVSIPSGVDPALSLPSSRVNTLDSFRMSSIGSGRISSIGSSFDWLSAMGAPSKPSSSGERISTVDFLTKGLLGEEERAEEEPTLSPEHEAEEQREPSAPVAPIARGKPEAVASRAKKNAREYVTDVHQWDILSERGGKANHHEGNKRYRKVVSEMKAQYRDTAAKTDKTDLSRSIVAYVHNYGGRFLKKDKNGRYYVMTMAEARKKTSQALRETKQLKWTDVDVQDHVDV